MYIAMNRFNIANKHKNDFVEIWKNRDSHLNKVPGFKNFKLLQGPGDENATVFVSHSTWESENAFKAWTQSDHFKKAHAQARAPKGTYLDHPKFEGFEAILTE